MTLPPSARRPGLRECVCGHDVLDVLDVVDSDTREQLVLDADPTPDGTVTVLAVGPVVTARRHGQPVDRGRRDHQCTALSLDDLVHQDDDVDPGIEQAGGVASTMTTSLTPLLDGADGRRLADLARPRRQLRWRISVCTADHLAAQRGVDHVTGRVRQHAGPLLVGKIHLVAAAPPQAAGKLELLRRAVEQGVVIGYPLDQLDAAAATLAADHRRWLIYAGARVLTAQCQHTAVYS